jgi:hypothetical protein
LEGAETVANKDDLLKKMRAEDFVENNGEVMRAINVKYFEYLPLKTVFRVMPDMSEVEFLKSINYLQLKGYILVRHMNSRKPTELSDADYTELEAKLSDKGIDLSGGFIVDEAVPM